jgi:AraC-like DNA-binding protein
VGGTVQIVAKLNARMLGRLRVVAGGDITVYPVASWSDLGDAVRRYPVEVAVVDPCADGGAPHQDAIRGLRIAAPMVAVLIYTSITGEAMRTMADLMQGGWVRQCILDNFDDEPARFREVLEELCLPGLEEQVLADLLPIMAASDAPQSLSNAVAQLFRTPLDFRDVEDVARAAGLSRRHLDRWFEKLGLASARTMLLAARVLRGYQYAQNPGFSMAEVARRLRYPDWRVFSEHVRTVTGLTPSAWLQKVRPEECVAQLVARLLRCDEAIPLGPVGHVRAQV